MTPPHTGKNSVLSLSDPLPPCPSAGFEAFRAGYKVLPATSEALPTGFEPLPGGYKVLPTASETFPAVLALSSMLHKLCCITCDRNDET